MKNLKGWGWEHVRNVQSVNTLFSYLTPPNYKILNTPVVCVIDRDRDSTLSEFYT